MRCTRSNGQRKEPDARTRLLIWTEAARRPNEAIWKGLRIHLLFQAQTKTLTVYLNFDGVCSNAITEVGSNVCDQADEWMG